MVCCCVKGRVYNVTTSANFRPGGHYSFLSGADATMGMGRMSLDAKLVNCMRFDELTEDEWRCVDSFVEYMDGKYDCIGVLWEYEEWAHREKGTGLKLDRQH